MLDDGRTPVFWAGFWPGGNKGIDTRQALADFISSVNGFQLADTEWGQAAESEGANNLEACTWARKKNWWNAASRKMAEAMALHNVSNIIIALHKRLKGDVLGKYSFYKTILYQAELASMGKKIMKKSTWNPQFEVFSITVDRAPPHESGCALASVVKYQLELYAKRPVTVWCRPCTTLQSCGSKEQVEKTMIRGRCIVYGRNTRTKCKKGFGYMTWEDGSQYSGSWKKGKMHGNGTYTYADGEIYRGDWKNGLRDGQGTSTDADGEKYQGGWKNNFMDGQGTYTYADGAEYQGGWKEGVKDGQGTVTLANGEKYQGGWKNGLRDGQGTMTWANGDKYQGQYKKNKMDGQGTYTSANGDIYQGQYKKNKRDGQGTFTSANGQKYQGEYKNGLPDGQGTFTLANGNMYKVWFKEGNLTKKVKEK